MVEIFPVLTGIALAQIAPGPNFLAVSSLALGTSRSAGVMCAIGVATSIFIWATLFALGIGAVISAYPKSLIVMKLVGGGYLLFLAGKAARTVWYGKQSAININKERRSLSQAYLTGVMVNLTNPKTAMMWAAIAMFLASTTPTADRFFQVGVGASLSATIIYGTYALLFSTGVALRAYARFFQVVELSFGAIFGALGAKLLVDGLREVRG